MLQFFRKYQKFFFIIVTFVIVISFVFFGSYNSFSGHEEAPNREIGHLIDGSVLKEQKLYGMIGLIQNGMEEGGQTVNFLNDNLVHREILLSGIGEILIEHSFETLQEDLEARWKRMKTYAPYSHPHAPFISAENAWKQFAPGINELLQEVREAPEAFSREQISLLFKLYSAQAEFPPHLLHQMLYYQERQDEQIRPDPGLPQANVALFGFQSVEDWFGSKFVEEIAKFILNAACIAREEGYVVTKEEAQIDLYSNVYRGLNAYSKGEKISNESVQNYFAYKIRSLGINEKDAALLWADVMSVGRHFNEVGEAVFIDDLALNQFKNFAKATHKIRRYRLSHSLGLKDFRDLLKFQWYLEAVAEGDVLGLDIDFRSPESVKEAHSSLVYKAFDVEMTEVSKIDVAARISLKETWNWEGKEENFAILQEKFPQLKEGATEEERFKALDALDEKIRFKVDQYARLTLVDQSKGLIDEMLEIAPVQRKTLNVSTQEELFSGSAFLNLLENEGQKLNRYSLDENTYYRINVLKKGENWKILSFAEANQKNVIDPLLDSLLAEAYESFEYELPFEEVKDEVGARVYVDLLASIEENNGAKIEELDEYAKYRFDGFLQRMQISLKEGKEVIQEGLFALVETEELVPGVEDALAIGDFSSIKEGGFYQLLEETKIEATESEISALKAPLKRDAQKELMQKIVKRFEENELCKKL